MDRRRFLKVLSGLPLAALVPVQSVRAQTLLLETPLAGFQYYRGAEIWESLAAGEEVRLVREPANKHDTKAIAVYRDNLKLGYIPRVDNSVLANLMDQGRPVDAVITARKDLNKCWNPVDIGVWLMG